jgi:hypothetical protein
MTNETTIAPMAPSDDAQRTIPPEVMNWLRVLGTAELPHIDQGVRH